LAQADAEAKEAETAVQDAATDVVIGECELAIAPLDRLLSDLFVIDDLIHAAGWLRDKDGVRPREVTPKLLTALNRLRPLRSALAQARPQRVILTGSPEEAMAGRLEAYRKALAKNADATLPETPEQEIRRVSPPEGNAILAARESAARRIGGGDGVAA